MKRETEKVGQNGYGALYELVDEYARMLVHGMTPRQIGLILHPNAKPVPLADVPEDVLVNYRKRYTTRDLEKGQFLELSDGKYTFIMSQKTKQQKDKKA